VAIAFFFIPAFIIRPFTHQSPEGLHLAMALRQHAPVVTLTAALLSLAMDIALWFAVGRWRKAALVAVMLVVAFSAVMSRLNYFEWMFHPVDGARFEAASATKLDKDEMILAVRYANDARAYPISEMAYHHVLNDTVAGVPIAVTY
jgi:muconolactone delta-isomerase